MAFEESLMMLTSFPIINEDDHQTRNSLSRLSICTSSVQNDVVKEEIEIAGGFDGAEADGEVSDEGKKKNRTDSDSDKELYSLPVTPSRRKKNFPVSVTVSGEFSDLDESGGGGSKCNLRRQRRVIKEKKVKKKGILVNGESDGNGNGNGGGEGLTVLTTRAKGGEKSLRMGLEEVKACRDLGLELEFPGRISVSTGSNFDTQTSSGGNSPIATWRISSPGDDPKEVKARLKVWAQAVALASASR